MFYLLPFSCSRRFTEFIELPSATCYMYVRVCVSVSSVERDVHDKRRHSLTPRICTHASQQSSQSTVRPLFTDISLIYCERKCAVNSNNDTMNLFFFKLQSSFWQFQAITVSESCLIKLFRYILSEKNRFIFQHWE